jgi:hypothetical protein
MYCSEEVELRFPRVRRWIAPAFTMLILGCGAQDQPAQQPTAAIKAEAEFSPGSQSEVSPSLSSTTQAKDPLSIHSGARAIDQQPDLESDSSSLRLFDGSSLEGWKSTAFGGEGACRVEDGAIVLEPGFPLTGITSTRDDLPKMNYEILLEARKTSGIDFFVGLTFPVDETHCSLIVGGWAGPVVGLSMIDDQDAANNETRHLMKFELKQWYQVRLQVTPNRIVAWIDDKKVVDQDVTGRRLSVRNETLPSRPLGLCCFETRAEIRKFELKSLPSTANIKN